MGASMRRNAVQFYRHPVTGLIAGILHPDTGVKMPFGAVVTKVFVGTGGAVGGTGTIIPSSVSLVGDYLTKLEFMDVFRDDLGLADMVNHRISIPAGFSECRFTYNLAWAPHVDGWRGCRTKNSAGQNYGNVRLSSVGSGATTNNFCQSPWIEIVGSGMVAPDTINAGDFLEFWPAQTSGVDLICGADLASSFVQLEIR